jgi:preprotein translocase subunit SecY
MINVFFEKLKMIAKDARLRGRVLFVLVALFVFRLLAAIPIPGVDQAALENFFNNSQIFGFLNIFSGSGLSGLSVIMLGVGPYITASIIMQLLTMMSDKLKSLYHEEGEAGKRKFAQYSRLLTIPISIIQGSSFIILLQRQAIIPNLDAFSFITNIIVITAGSLLLMWIGELITEFGVGNGISLLIFAGIVASLPNSIQQIMFTYSADQIPTYIAFIFVALAIIFGVVIITEAERPIPITYAKQVRSSGRVTGGTSTYLPLRLNQAGVIPIIFALSIMMLPQIITSLLSSVNSVTAQAFIRFISSVISNQLMYGILYFVFVFLFTYFYTAVTFDPDAISKNLQKSGAFIPGVRPGESTAKYIGNVISRITLVGAIFLGAIAVLPIIVQGVSGITSLTIGGTALLIAVSVVIDLIKKIDAQLTMREY